MEPVNWPDVPKNAWGPVAWDWAHQEAIRFPRSPSGECRARALERLRSFLRGLPCPECRRHAAAYLERSPPDLADSISYQVWMWTFHNWVNASLKKPYFSFDDYLDLYAEFLEEVARAPSPVADSD